MNEYLFWSKSNIEYYSLRTSELKPYFHNNEDSGKKIGTLSTEIGPAATKIFKFWPKKAYLSMGT